MQRDSEKISEENVIVISNRSMLKRSYSVGKRDLESSQRSDSIDSLPVNVVDGDDDDNDDEYDSNYSESDDNNDEDNENENETLKKMLQYLSTNSTKPKFVTGRISHPIRQSKSYAFGLVDEVSNNSSSDDHECSNSMMPSMKKSKTTANLFMLESNILMDSLDLDSICL